jgi:hypothetical protein
LAQPFTPLTVRPTGGLDATGAFDNACGIFKGVGAFFCNFQGRNRIADEQTDIKHFVYV